MAYTALPDRRMPYDNDGTVVAYGPNTITASSDIGFAQGVAAYLSGSDAILFNGSSWAQLAANPFSSNSFGVPGLRPWWWFFPESREVTGIVLGVSNPNEVFAINNGIMVVQGSLNSTNGVDGTWETASLGSTTPNVAKSIDGWRRSIFSVSFTGPKKVARLTIGATGILTPVLLHLYGEKAAGQTPDDLIFIDHDTTPGVEFTAAEDFGDRPLGTSVVRQFRVKNASATLTAGTINLQCNDADFAISTDGTTWVVTINIASLAAGAESATMYIRNTTPAPGNVLGPRFARIVALVGSWT